MLMQRSSPPRFDKVDEPVAAGQRGFPEAVIQNREIGQKPNRPSAAEVSDVSVAGRSRLMRMPRNSRPHAPNELAIEGPLLWPISERPRT